MNNHTHNKPWQDEPTAVEISDAMKSHCIGKSESICPKDYGVPFNL